MLIKLLQYNYVCINFILHIIKQIRHCFYVIKFNYYYKIF